ncbi:transposase [Streptomyces arboris]|uniref:transposase n=1 Tax=Streptomyces arboris TaxID=2600619 RepID=UPI003BF59B38
MFTTTQLRPAGSRRQALDAFADLLFGKLPRADQREWANTYLRGLLSTPGKKSMRRLAESVSSSPTAWYSLQQFISGSSWDWEQPRGELARWVDQRASVRAWTVATAAVTKRGDQSVGVHVDTAAARSAGAVVPVVADLSDLDDVCLAVARLEARGLSFVVAVPPGMEVLGEAGPPGAPQPHRRSGEAPPNTAGGLLELQSGRLYRYTAAIMGASGGFRQVPVLSAYFRLTRRPQGPPAAQQTYRLFSQPDSALQGAVWMTNLTHRRLDELIELTLLHTSAMATVTCLDERFALLDFAGRSFPGWHHHMTLASAAYAFARLSHPGELPPPPVVEKRADAMTA